MAIVLDLRIFVFWLKQRGCPIGPTKSEQLFAEGSEVSQEVPLGRYPKEDAITDASFLFFYELTMHRCFFFLGLLLEIDGFHWFGSHWVPRVPPVWFGFIPAIRKIPNLFYQRTPDCHEAFRTRSCETNRRHSAFGFWGEGSVHVSQADQQTAPVSRYPFLGEGSPTKIARQKV